MEPRNPIVRIKTESIEKRIADLIVQRDCEKCGSKRIEIQDKIDHLNELLKNENKSLKSYSVSLKLSFTGSALIKAHSKEEAIKILSREVDFNVSLYNNVGDDKISLMIDRLPVKQIK